MISLFIGALAGTMIAIFPMYAAWDHNPQGVYYDIQSGDIHWLNWLGIGASWFILSGGAFAITSFISILIAQHIRKYILK